MIYPTPRSELFPVLPPDSSSRTRDLLASDARGLFCALGNFHIDPWKPVATAVITHAHADHARPGSALYYCAAPGASILRKRLGDSINLVPLPYGQRVKLNDVTISLHPAGHVLGSAQVRVESADQVWVAAGDYKRASDPSCDPFEVVPCDTFITEATFALPIYRWPSSRQIFDDIERWWRTNAERGRTSILFCYALGKAQRILAELKSRPWSADRRVFTHGSVEPLNRCYREILGEHALLRTFAVGEVTATARPSVTAATFAGSLIIAPPSAAGSTWMRRFGPNIETGFASGWMRVRALRRRRGYDTGFVLSDHADWDQLLETIAATRATRILATHGSTEPLTAHLRSQGLNAQTLPTLYNPEEES